MRSQIDWSKLDRRSPVDDRAESAMDIDRSGFREDLKTAQGLDPLCPELFEDGREITESLDDEEEHEEVRKQLCSALAQLLHFWLRGDPEKPKFAETVGRRVIAAAWVIGPDYLDGKSLAALSRMEGIDSSRAWLSKCAIKFSDTFGLKNRAMSSKQARASYSMGQRKRWRSARNAFDESKKDNTREMSESEVEHD